ncbi:MAG: ferrous iron transport protein B [Clostridia bacterium]|nr:ferrous iron transport protein B [Clostridia bacterium]
MSLRIALAGNPNSGKTTMFNALTGSNQYVGNWPGVTVEKKEGKLKKNNDVIITDLPGIYSLSPYTLEEVVARNYLIVERPDAIINIVDGTNLNRNLYLTTQLAELGIPMVMAINMMDVVRKTGDKFNIDELSRRFGCPVFEVSALKSDGILEAAEAAIEAAKKGASLPMHNFSGEVEHAIAHIEEAAVHGLPEEQQRWYAIKLFERDEKVLEQLKLSPKTVAHIERDIVHVEQEFDDDAESIIANERYVYIDSVIKSFYKKKSAPKMSVSEKIDRVVTNRVLALPIFVAIMFLVYYISISTVGTFATDWANDGVFGDGWSFFGLWVPGIPSILGGWLDAANAPAWLESLIVDGIIGGLGGILGFVPQILVLFLMLAFLEACGYMSRIAFILDRVFRKFGLSGKSFIPLLVGSGCGVPGIMASRTIESESDRRMTVMTTTFVPCSAKLPMIAMIAAVAFGGPEKGWWLAPVCYLIGVAAVIVSGIALKKTRPFASNPTPFVMELPPYHMPTVGNVLRATWERGWSFIKKAGTIILLSTVIIWLGTTLGTVDGKFGFYLEAEGMITVMDYIGSAISWIFTPLGFNDPTAAVATVMGLVAKEEVVAVFDVTGFAGFSSRAAAMSFLLFNLLCAPCFAAMGAIRREMNNWKWTTFAIVYQCLFAYAVSLVVYQFGLLFTGEMGGLNILWLALASLIVVFALFMLFRPYKASAKLTETVKVSKK